MLNDWEKKVKMKVFQCEHKPYTKNVNWKKRVEQVAEEHGKKHWKFNKRDKKTIHVKLKIQALKFALLVSKCISFRWCISKFYCVPHEKKEMHLNCPLKMNLLEELFAYYFQLIITWYCLCCNHELVFYKFRFWCTFY